MTHDANGVATPPPPFPYKTQPDPKQREALLKSAGKPAFFLAMEMGVGKTKVFIDTVAYLYLQGKIDGVVILAPNGVHTQWVTDELPKHMSDAVPYAVHHWRSDHERAARAKRVKRGLSLKEQSQEWAVSQLAQRTDVLPILVVNSEAIVVPLCRRAIGTFLTRRRCMFGVDESGDFATPGAKRTKALMFWRTRAPYRRTMDGTPGGGDVLKLYAPYRFLNPKILGCDTFAVYKDTYAEWHELGESTNGRKILVQKRDPKTGAKVFKNLEQLRARMDPYTFRCTLDEAHPDIPKPYFTKRWFELTEVQWRLTLEIMEQMQAELDGGGTVTATNVLTQYLRYQQIACGYVPPDIIYGEETEPIRILPGPNPRLEMAIDSLLRWGTGVPTIMWTRFHMDIDLLSIRLKQEGINFVTYDGRSSDEERADAKARFMGGDVDLFIGNPAAGGRGLNLQRARFVLYYANYFGLIRRLQSQGRARRRGTAWPVTFMDLMGYRSIDTLIVRALLNDQDVQDAITGDPKKEWLADAA